LVVAVAPFLVVVAFGVNFAAKHVEAVADVEHGVGIDAVMITRTDPVISDPVILVTTISAGSKPRDLPIF